MIHSFPVAGTDAALKDALLAGGLPTEDIDEPGRRIFRVERDGALLGYGGFELYGKDALLRSVVVPLETRGTGAGRVVAEQLLGLIGSAGGRQVFLLTTTAAEFFEHLGFGHTDRASAPAAILATRQAASICSSADLLSRRLDD